MNKILDTVNSFKIESSQMIISCNKINIILPIKNGSVIVNMINELKEKIGINDINKNDQIIVLYKETEFEKNYIKPIKIIKLLNYTFYESSDSENNII